MRRRGGRCGAVLPGRAGPCPEAAVGAAQGGAGAWVSNTESGGRRGSCPGLGEGAAAARAPQPPPGEGGSTGRGGGVSVPQKRNRQGL